MEFLPVFTIFCCFKLNFACIREIWQFTVIYFTKKTKKERHITGLVYAGLLSLFTSVIPKSRF